MTIVIIRRATPEDAPSMVSLLNAIIAKGGSTAYSEPFTEEKMMDQYVARNPEFGISCMVAIEEDNPSTTVLAFQGLEWSDPNYPEDDKLPADWTFIATFVATGQQGKGIGRKLFQSTLEAAKAKRVTKIDATIRHYNKGGQSYYDRMGFKDYKSSSDTVSKRFDLC